MAELRATYRLQLTSGFGFAQARELVPYLRDLGISHLYLSPSFQARTGSTHGYDVVDPERLSDALGGEEEFRNLASCARDAGLGIVLDVVPNHMAADDENRYWADEGLRQRFFDVEPATGIYRRFFDIAELAAIRQEREEVFEATHELALSLVRDGVVDGLRVNHPDGLADPRGYLRRLRERGAENVWMEKILDPGERLRDWPVQGTVGYEFLNDACALFVDPNGEAELTELWHSIAGDERTFGEVALEAKLEQVHGSFWEDVERLARELQGPTVAAGDGAADAFIGDPPRDTSGSPKNVDLETLGRALASLPVYRTYIEPAEGHVEDADRQVVAESGMDPAVAGLLLGEEPEVPPGFVTRFQQTTPAVMAKGVEDTAFYRYGRLLALCDVGGDPSRFGISVGHFHAANAERAERFPRNLLTTQTHDAKRSADVRMRIAALASMASDWREHVALWMGATEELRRGGAPDDVERYFIFQTLVGAWPIEAERVEGYMEKALREAKRNTNWIEPDREWEAAVLGFCRRLYEHRSFLESFEPFVVRLAALGDQLSLRQLVLKLTVPGIPDIHQGDELPYFALVDPDNRRPVDFDWNQAMLRRLMGGSAPDPGTLKLFVTMRLLGLRARAAERFADGYEPLEAGSGICAFVRGRRVMVIVAVRPAGFEQLVVLPSGRWRDVFRGEERTFGGEQSARSVLGEHGVAVFEAL